MTSTAHLTLGTAPKFASMTAWDCARCEHEELRKPVFLSDGRAYGTRCAAIAMGLVPDTATATEGRKALKVAQEAHTAAEARARRIASDLAAAPWEAWCATFGGIREAIDAHGGFAAARAAFKLTNQGD